MSTRQATGTNSSNLAGAQGVSRSGIGSVAGQRLPSPPRERRPLLAVLAVLLILIGGLSSAYLVMQSGRRVEAIQLAADVPAGQPIPLSALQEVQVGDTGINFINWSARGQVAQAYAAVPLVKGALLTNSMVVAAAPGSAGRAVVGLSLKSGASPSNMADGDHLALYATGAQGCVGKGGDLLAEDAVVTDAGGAGSASGDNSDSGNVNVTVPLAELQNVLLASTQGCLAAALLPTGTKLPAASVIPPGGGGGNTTKSSNNGQR